MVLPCSWYVPQRSNFTDVDFFHQFSNEVNLLKAELGDKSVEHLSGRDMQMLEEFTGSGFCTVPQWFSAAYDKVVVFS
jgi:hypothetical protein